MRDQIDDELEYHIQQRVSELVAEGHSPSEAHRIAEAAFGDLERTRHECQALYMVEGDRKGDGMMGEATRDVRHAFRAIRRQPGFAAAVILTLGLGIGANAAIFSVLNGVLFQPLPYDNPEELVRLWQADRVNGTRFEGFSVPDYFDVLDRNTVFSDMVATETRTLTLTAAGSEPAQLQVIATSHGLLRVLGASPALGREFTVDEDVPDAEQVVMLGHDLWMGRYGGDPEVLGRSLILDEIPHRIVGVAPADFAYPFPGVDVWLPLQEGPTTRPRGQHNFGVVARLQSDASIDRANSNMGAIATALEEEYPEENTGRSMWAQPLHENVVGGAQSGLILLAGAVGLVLLIACVNVANLLLVRATTREREVAVRLAMGAGRGRLLRQFVTEYLVLALVGGAAGLGLAFLGVRGLIALSPEQLPRIDNIQMDGSVLLFTLFAALLTGLACGVLPAIHGSGVDVRSSMSDGGARGARGGRGSNRLRDGLVVFEVAMTVVLAASAGLLMKSIAGLRSVDPGFEPNGVVFASVQLPASRYPQSFDSWPEFPEVLAFQRAVVERAERMPGVTHAAVALNAPTNPGWTTSFTIEGVAEHDLGTEEIRLRIASSGYPAAVGLDLIEGRLLDSRDDLADAAPVALVNEATVRRYFPDGDAIGRHIQTWGVDREIVGVVRDVRFMGPGVPSPPAVYPTFAFMPFAAFTIVLKTAGDPEAVAPQLRAAVAELDGNLALGTIQTADEVLSSATAQSGFTALLLGAFAAASLLLAAVGIYGVISFGVNQRTHEIGVRLSLGAPQQSVVRDIVWRGMRLAGLGLVLGLVAMVGANRLLSSLLFEVGVFDPMNVVAVVALAGTVAIVASYIPARRASALNPVTAIRGE